MEGKSPAKIGRYYSAVATAIFACQNIQICVCERHPENINWQNEFKRLVVAALWLIYNILRYCLLELVRHLVILLIL